MTVYRLQWGQLTISSHEVSELIAIRSTSSATVIPTDCVQPYDLSVFRSYGASYLRTPTITPSIGAVPDNHRNFVTRLDLDFTCQYFCRYLSHEIVHEVQKRKKV